MTGREPDLPARPHPPHRRRRVPCCLVHAPASEGEPTVPPLTTTTTTAPPVSTPQTGLGKAVEAAKKVAGKADADDRRRHDRGDRHQGRRRPPRTSSPQPAAIAAVPAEALAKLPKDVAGALKARKVLVLGVLVRGRQAVAPARRRRPLRPQRAQETSTATTARWSSSASRSTSSPPTARWSTTWTSRRARAIVVIDRDLKGTVLTGYVDTRLDQPGRSPTRAATASTRTSPTPTCAMQHALHGLRHRARALVATRRSTAQQAADRVSTSARLAIIRSTTVAASSACPRPAKCKRPQDRIP